MDLPVHIIDIIIASLQSLVYTHPIVETPAILPGSTSSKAAPVLEATAAAAAHGRWHGIVAHDEGC